METLHGPAPLQGRIARQWQAQMHWLLSVLAPLEQQCRRLTGATT